MNFKNFKWGGFIVTSVFILAYPIVKALISTANRLMIFLDTTIVVSMVFILIGIFKSFYLAGDLDKTFYLYSRVRKTTTKEFSAFKADADAKRRGEFNDMLFSGLVWLILAIIASYIFFA